MEVMSGLAKSLIVFGLVLIVAGAVLYLAGRVPGVGRLPGDIFFKKGNFSFFFPITTSVLISVIATVLLNLFMRK